MISEAFHTDKAPSCTYYEVAKDGIAIIVNTANPITDITLNDLKNIYDVNAGDKAVIKWSDLSK